MTPICLGLIISIMAGDRRLGYIGAEAHIAKGS